MAPSRPEWPALIGIDPADLIRAPFGETQVWTAFSDSWFRRWRGTPPQDHEIDCLKSGNLVANRRGRISCAEVEVARAFRRVGWKAYWLATCGRRNQQWRRFMAAALLPRRPTVKPLPLLPPDIAEIALAGGATGIPDVVAWDPTARHPVFVELKGPRDKSTGEAGWICEARRRRRIRTADVVCLNWTFRD